MRYVVTNMRKLLERQNFRSSDIRKIITAASSCFCLMFLGPHFSPVDDMVFGPGAVHGVEGEAQDGTNSSSGTNDTPSEQDIADFAAEFDKDGDGEIDEPEEADEEVGAEDEAEEEESEELDDRDDQDDSDDQDQDNREDEYLDDEKILEEDIEDIAHTGKNRDDVDGDASPDYRLSGYDRYFAEGRLRRLGGLDELKPLIEREEKMILEQ